MTKDQLEACSNSVLNSPDNKIDITTDGTLKISIPDERDRGIRSSPDVDAIANRWNETGRFYFIRIINKPNY